MILENRVLEPELMDDERQSIAYAKADFSASNQLFVDGFVRDFPGHLRHAVDIGCGPGDVVIRLARAASDIHITAIDGSNRCTRQREHRLRAIDRGDVNVRGRVRLVEGYVPGVALPDRSYDAILSKDLLHHLPDPSALWKEVVRLGQTGAAVYVMDLVRPLTTGDAHCIVDTVAANEDPILREDFYNSLCAAFTIDEVAGQLRAATLDLRVTQVSDRHMLVSGLLTSPSL